MEGEGALSRVLKARALQGVLPQKIFKFEGSETLFSALVLRDVSEKSTSNTKMANNHKSL